jgi:hypothetical protein
MRKLVWGNTQSPAGECIAGMERTQGTETSKYLEEKKETSIPSVAASESGHSPNRDSSRGCGASRGYKTVPSGSVWKVAPKRVKVPYAAGIGPR